MSLEGELRVGLRLHGGRIAAVDITSTRPDIALRLLQGRHSDEAQAAVPLLFSVCARSQAATSRLACAAAAGLASDGAALAQARAAVAEETVREAAWQMLLHLPRWIDENPTPAATAAARAAQAWRWRGRDAQAEDTPAAAIAHAVFGCSAQAWLQRESWPAVVEWAAGLAPDGVALAQARAAVAEETVRETAWQMLLHLPRWIDENPTPAATAAARAAHAWRWRGRDAQAEDAPAAAIAHAVFGCSAQTWLQRESWPAVVEWAAAGETAAARYLHRLASLDVVGDAGPALPLLPPPTPGWLSELAAAAAADPAYTRHPLWQGRPAETGALARLQRYPLVGSAAAAAPSRPLARHGARLRELALLLEGRLQPGLGALTLAPGSGVAWADNARGLLVHHVQLDGERVRLYRIVAPTEWNFHPQGAVAAGLVDAPVADAAAARQRALRLINSLDPCVSCHVEVADA